jgi:hypothetical protein
VVNTYKLRVLIELSKKSADADLNIKQKFVWWEYKHLSEKKWHARKQKKQIT